jgi:hypothetical protein
MAGRFISLSPLLYNPVYMQYIDASEVWDAATILVH